MQSDPLRRAADPGAEPPGRRGSNVPASTPRIHIEHLGAVAAVWGDDPDSVELHATLAFRIGEADERLRTRGACHLLAALVLAGVDPPSGVDVHSSVRSLRTRFVVSGPDTGVAETLTAIARAIATLRTDRIDGIADRVARSWQPPENWDTRLMSLRFGSRGYGLSALPLVGLTDVDPRTLDALVQDGYNAGNAVVSANRRPAVPPDLAALPRGEHRPLPEPRQRTLEFPALARGDENRIAISFLGRFNATAQLGVGNVIDRIHERCRMIDPSAPRPRSVARRTGAGLATVNIAVQAPSEALVAIQESIMAALFELSMTGPSAETLGRTQVSLRRSGGLRAVPGSGAVDAAATDLLYREDRDLPAALRATPADVAHQIRDAVSRAIWVVPDDAALRDRRFVPIRDHTDAAGEGEVFTAADGSEATLVIATDRFTVSEPPVTMRFDDLVAVEAASDGSLVAWNENGTVARLDTSAWVDGHRIGSLLQERIDPWIVIGNPAGSEEIQPGTADTDR